MKKIAQIILAVAIVALVYVIYDQISTPIKFDDELKAKKAQVIDRIKEHPYGTARIQVEVPAFHGQFRHADEFHPAGYARTRAQDRRRG